MRKIPLLVALLTASVLHAQHIGYLIPAGGKAGETVEVLVGGQQFGNIRKARISGEGITVESVTVVPNIPQISGSQRKFVSRWMSNRVTGKNGIPEKPQDEEELKTWRKHSYFDKVDQLTPLQFHLLAVHMFVRRNPLQMSPAINSQCIVKLKIAPDAKPGRREFRLMRGSLLCSNPLPFYVDALPEALEPFHPVPPQKRGPYVFKMPAVLNGQIMPGETDVWHFDARKGDRLVFQTFARSLVPFMGDCVPGYFQCILELRNARNQCIAAADDNGFEPDPLLCCTIPEDGEYTLHVRDALYRGRADFVYRIRATFGPEPEQKLVPPALDLPKKKQQELPPGGKTPFPVLISGCIEKPGQADTFVIEAKQGEKIVGEVFARRLGSALDSLLTVTDRSGKPVASNDDFPRPLAGTVLQHTDSYLCFTAPQTGEYTIRLTDTAKSGSARHGYFLRIDRPRPSFNLYVAPSFFAVTNHSAALLKIQVEPLDGFNEDILLSLKAPKHFSIVGSRIIPAGAGNTVITLTCSAPRQQLPVNAELIAEPYVRCSVCGVCGVRPGIRGRVFYGDEDTQAFAYTHLILSREWLLGKNWGPHGSQLVALADRKQTEVRIKAGGTAELPLIQSKLPNLDPEMKFELRNAPEGLSISGTKSQDLPGGRKKIILVLKAEKKARPARVNLPVTVCYSYKTKPDKNGKSFQRKSEFILPVLLFTIIGD